MRAKKPSALAAQLRRVSRQANDESQVSIELGRVVRAARTEIFDKIPLQTNGMVLSRRLSLTTDQAIKVLFDLGAQRFPDQVDNVALMAVGGYGRERLAPYSDIDLLILHKSRAATQAKPLIDFILYALWDAQLSVSQAVHSPAGAIDLGKEDLSFNTSLLDARYLAGSRILADDFVRRFDAYREKTVSQFIEEKLSEREDRLADDAYSRYAIEPDVKEGKGGLRDLHTLHWLTRYARGQGEKSAVLTYLSSAERRAYEKAARFLWSVRMQLHHLAGRADDRLTQPRQQEVADRLLYQQRGSILGVERFMKHYFLTSREVGFLTGLVCTRLEEEELKKSGKLRSSLSTLARGKRPGRRIRPDGLRSVDMFVLRGDRLDFNEQADLATYPVDMFRLFFIAARAPSCDIHPNALRLVSQNLKHLDAQRRRDPEIREAFRRILLESDDLLEVLRDMAEVGLLGRYLPAFGMLVGEIKFGLYRRYTLDEHVLRSVSVLRDLLDGKGAAAHPKSAGILAETDRPLDFFLAVFLHETVSILPDQDEAKARSRISQSIRHFFDQPDDRACVLWAATHHKLLAHTASRRSVSSVNTVSIFAKEVGTRRRLDMLMVLTVCHLRVAGMNSWDQWIRRDITVLYEATCAFFEGGADGVAAYFDQRRLTLRRDTIRLLSGWSIGGVDAIFDRLPPHFYESVNAESAAAFCKLIRRVEGTAGIQGDVAVRALDDGLYEVLCFSRDKPGLFANIAGVIAGAGCQVRASAAFPVSTSKRQQPMAANNFVFQPDHHGHKSVSSLDLGVLAEQFRRAINEPGIVDVDVPSRRGDRRGFFDVESKVTLDMKSSDDCLVVEARGLDRAGLLFDLARVFAELGVSIRSAYIATYGEIAVDTFYVQDLPGYKITDRRRREGIRRRILAALRDG